MQEEHEEHHTCRQTGSGHSSLEIVVEDCIFRSHIIEIKNDKEETADKVEEGCICSVHAELHQGIKKNKGTENTDAQKYFLITIDNHVNL